MSTISARTQSALTRATASGSATAVARAGARAIQAIDRWAPSTLTILMYHRVGPPEDRPWLAPTMRTASPEEFEAQLDLVRSLARYVTLDEVVAAVLGEGSLPDRAVLVTFDDAYADFADHAWPILQSLDVPAAMFVATAYPDGGDTFWWDDLWASVTSASEDDLASALDAIGLSTSPADITDRSVVFRAVRDHLWQSSHDGARDALAVLVDRARPTLTPSVLTWDQLGDLAHAGLAVAAHSRTHPLLTRLSTPAARDEIAASVEELERRGFRHARVLAYPGGDHDDRIRTAAAAAGCVVAMTTRRGTNRLPVTDPLRLRRINVGRSTTPALLSAQLMPSLGRFPRWSAP